MIGSIKLQRFVSNVISVLSIVIASLFLANFAISELWIYELVGLPPNSDQLPDLALFTSVSVFFIPVVIFYFNRLQAAFLVPHPIGKNNRWRTENGELSIEPSSHAHEKVQ